MWCKTDHRRRDFSRLYLIIFSVKSSSSKVKHGFKDFCDHYSLWVFLRLLFLFKFFIYHRIRLKDHKYYIINFDPLKKIFFSWIKKKCQYLPLFRYQLPGVDHSGKNGHPWDVSGLCRIRIYTVLPTHNSKFREKKKNI